MHELPLVKTLLNQAIEAVNKANAKKVNYVILEMGKLHDFIPDIVIRYWNYSIPNTILQGSELRIEEKEATIKCDQCERIYLLDTRHLAENKCPECGCDTGTIVTGRELRIRGIEIEEND